MITRIVIMTFQEDKVADFLKLFETIKKNITSFEGCKHLELMQEHGKKNVYVTYSIWESEMYLDVYRTSEFFEDTWRKTKALFADKPKAISLEKTNY
jgi:quinol monooxygenase YgiN